MAEAPARTLAQANARLGLICAAVFALMVGAAFAAVPLYRLFCQATGFNGATVRRDANTTQVLARTIEVRFDTNVRGMPWTFTADQLTQRVNIGATNLAFFRVRNDSTQAITGRAVFNVTPETAGGYFVKLECFCFREQTLQPGQTMDFPVVYYVDPRLVTDPETRDFQSLTLSYTFLPSVNGPAAQTTASQAPPGLGEAARARL